MNERKKRSLSATIRAWLNRHPNNEIKFITVAFNPNTENEIFIKFFAYANINIANNTFPVSLSHSFQTYTLGEPDVESEEEDNVDNKMLGEFLVKFDWEFLELYRATLNQGFNNFEL